MHPRTFIAAGTSAADGLEQIERAVERVRQSMVDVIALSPWYETTPVGNAGTRFINGVIEVATSLLPLELLDRLQQIERDLGRSPGERWGARVIDLDLLAYGDDVIEHQRLRLPHPALWYRRFVLDPWEQIAAEWVVPRWQMTVADLRRRLLQRPLPLRLIGGTSEERQEIADASVEEFGGMVTVSSVPIESEFDPLRISLGYLPDAISCDDDRWLIDLSQLASDLRRSTAETAHYILTAALDEPRVAIEA